MGNFFEGDLLLFRGLFMLLLCKWEISPLIFSHFCWWSKGLKHLELFYLKKHNLAICYSENRYNIMR